MNFYVLHDIRGRMRIRLDMGKMTGNQADILLYFLYSLEGVKRAKVYGRTKDAVICYGCGRESLVEEIRRFRFEEGTGKAIIPEETGREITSYYQEKLADRILWRVVEKCLLPKPLRMFVLCCKALKYFQKGIMVLARGKLEVPVLDAVAIGVSMLQKDFKTASAVVFLLGIGELLEDWTHRKSVDDLARSMALNTEKVWLKKDGVKRLAPATDISKGDEVVVHMGSVIPFDGIVAEGEALVSQSSLTGEPLPVRKGPKSSVYAGTVVEEGELSVLVREVSGATRYEKIVQMIEESEKLKSSVEGKAAHLADALVPYSFFGASLVYGLTGNLTKALSVLMVDFSCALKLSIPLAVLSAMGECHRHKITVKGGKFLEAVGSADVMVFDKTGTLTEARPAVAEVIPFGGNGRAQMLRLAACLEEHFPHSIAQAVLRQAERELLAHDEMHTKVEYILAHGIASTVQGQKVVIGSAHFVFEDEGCIIPPREQEKYEALSREYSHLYLAVAGELAAVILIDDPLRREAAEVIRSLRERGVAKIVMMTGDSARTALAVAETVGVDAHFAEVLPQDKADYIRREQKAGRTVVMIGDGINDSLALSVCDAGIAISEGAQLAREVADITISENSLYSLITLRDISSRLMGRIHSSYRFVVGFNLGLILLGVANVLAPGTSALLHNLSTLGLGLKNTTDLLK